MIKSGNLSGVWIGLSAALLAVGALIRVPMYPVPLTLQTFVICLIPMVFGPRIAFFGILLYIVLGLAGFPVFAGGGGIGYVLMPTFGYILGFLLCSVPAGFIRNKINGLAGLTISGVTAVLITNVCGVIVLYLNVNFIQGAEMSLTAAAAAGFLAFLIPDALSVAAAVAAAPLALRMYESVTKITGQGSCAEGEVRSKRRTTV